GIPKGMAQRVRQLSLTVSPAGIIQGMKIEEIDGATTAFAFTQIEENAVIPASDFTFTTPKGISVVDGQSPI
ncbi:MAG TPA: outer-membrane lipoprotein carrier protein LolA, partial [Acidobacteriaceae bacterium]